MAVRELTASEALDYLDDIAHGRKMEFEPHILRNRVKRDLERLEELEKAFVALSKNDEKVTKELSKEIEKNRVLEIIFEAPYIVDLLFRKGELGKEASERYMWGTISDKDVERVKEFFADGKRD